MPPPRGAIAAGRHPAAELIGYVSLPFGVVTLAERAGASCFTEQGFGEVVDLVAEHLRRFDRVHCIGQEIRAGGVRLIGTSGTVTTLAGVALALPRYRRPLVDGRTLEAGVADRAMGDLFALGRDGLAAHPCVGPERVEFVLPGCAVYAAIRQVWQVPSLTVADRGLREGMLLRMIRADAAALRFGGNARPRAGAGRTRGAGQSRRRPGRPSIASIPSGPAGARPPPPGAGRGLSTRLRTAKGRSKASQRWLERQLNDPYVRAAQQRGLRSRAAFKLIEMDEQAPAAPPRRPGARPRRRARRMDPGGGGAVGAERAGGGGGPPAHGPGAGRDRHPGRLEDEAVAAAALAALGGSADLVLSDMAPNTTGHGATDHLRIMGLAELALDTALAALAPGGGFVAKVFQGGGERTFLDALKRAIRARVRHAKPPASRKGSSELYVVATGFRGREG